MQIQPILVYFWAIFGLYQPPGPLLLDLGSPFLHILDPPLKSNMNPTIGPLGTEQNRTPVHLPEFKEKLWSVNNNTTRIWIKSNKIPTNGPLGTGWDRTPVHLPKVIEKEMANGNIIYM